MLITLDMNLDEELDYRELARGMEAWKKEKREEKRRDLSRESTSLSVKSGINFLIVLMEQHSCLVT